MTTHTFDSLAVDLSKTVAANKETWIRSVRRECRIPPMEMIRHGVLVETIEDGWSKTTARIGRLELGWFRWRVDLDTGNLIMEHGPGEHR